MRRSTKAVLAAVWTGALILTVVAAVDAQERTRYLNDVRDETRGQLDVVRSNLDEALDRRVALVGRLSAFVALDPDVDPERFRAYAASIAVEEPGLRSLRLDPSAGGSFVYPEGAPPLPDVASGTMVPEARVAGPFGERGDVQTVVVSAPVHVPGEDGRPNLWGVAHVEVYLEPIYGESKIVGWPGEAAFAVRGADGLGASGGVFFGDADLFADKPTTALVTFPGGQWQLAAAPDGGWPSLSPASWWIRLAGGVIAVLAAILVGVLVSEPDRLRRAVVEATRSAKESEARFRSVAETAQDAIVTIDRDARIAYVNRAAERLYRFRGDEVLGRPAGDVLGPEAGLIARRNGKASRRRGGVHDEAVVELDTHRTDGEEVPVEVSTATWMLDDEVYTTAIIRDVSERRRAQEGQARLASILDSTPDVVCIVDTAGHLRYVNQTARAMLGIQSDADISTHTLAVCYPDSFRKTLHDQVLPSVMAQGSWRGEGALLRADGSELPVSQIFVAHHGENGAVDSIAVVARDMTEEREAREEIKREKDRFRTLAEAAFEGIVIHDKGRIMEANAAFARMYGYTREELIGRDLMTLVAEDSRAAVADHLREPSDEAYEVASQRKDGSLFTVEVAAKHFPFQDRIVRVVAVRDITERKKAEAAQRIALERLMEIERLKEVDQFKTQLLNTASHELNTPITPIRLQLYLLKNRSLGELSAKHLKAIDVLDRNVERLALLVQDVLDVARLQSGRLRVQREPLDLEAVVREAIEAFEEPARQANVSLDTDVHDELWVLGDGHRLTQVLFNLLSNSLKFTPTGGKVRITARREDGQAVVRVEDTGAGLSEAQMRKLFRPFTQVHDTMERTRSGTGLGLYISKGILEEHEGRIWVESAGLALGAMFGFAIPLAAQEDLQAFVADRREREPTA